jgi:hypothetical protein
MAQEDRQQQVTGVWRIGFLIRLLALIAIGLAAGCLMTIALATLEHEVLVRTIGQEAIQATDTRGLAFVAIAYLAGVVTFVVILRVGWLRLRRHLGW